MSQHPQIRETVVIDREDSPGDKRLVAYFVPNDPAQLHVEELRRHLSLSLPEYMVPAAFVSLDALPVTPNGKLDRKALPLPDTTRPDLEKTYVAPRDPIEQMLQEIWTDVLNVDHIGVHDNFFDLGGHSLLAMKLVARIRELSSLDVPLSLPFEATSIRSMADHITGLTTGDRASHLRLEVLLNAVEHTPEHMLGTADL